jgi:penicillin-binding protein-related factor A (putative recombinase)
MNPGKQFEKDFQASIPKDAYFLRLTDSSPAGFGENENMRFSIQSPFDYILYRDGKMYALELKSTKEKSISFDGKSPMIKSHQIKALTRAAEFGITAGFVFNFRGQKTLFLSIQDFNSITTQLARKSLPISALNDKGVQITERQLKVHFRYDLEPILNYVLT